MEHSMVEQSSTPAGSLGGAAGGARGGARLRVALLLVGVAALVGIGAGAAAALLSHRSSPSSALLSGPAATWPAGSKIAPDFSLRDQDGQPVSLSALRGRPVIVTFIDPLCRDFCPLEAKVLNKVVDTLPQGQRPAIVAVSVNRWANARRFLLQDVTKWRLVPEWRWAVGSPAALGSVWKKYAIGVQATSKTIAGVTVHQISHTEAAYLVDASGHQRALFMWPFDASDVERTLASLHE
ncbi:MAG TPA: SCO family protein [Gaiellaceae bacterium]|nr:SCO family protein [Gaiellaceae bacterium]